MAIRKAPGFTVDRAGTIQEWPIEELTEINGEMAALGPWIEGTRSVDAENPDIDTLEMIASAAAALERSGFPMGGFYRKAFRRTPGGGLLVFPPVLASWMRESTPLDTLETEWERWIHPDLTGKENGEEAWSHSLGVIAWMMITGSDPFADERGEERRERIRRGVLPPLELYRPGIDPEWSAFVGASLGGGGAAGGRRPGIEAWRDTLKRWKKSGFPESPGGDQSGEEAGVIRENAGRKYRLMEKRLRSRRWLRRSGWKFLGLAGVVGIVLAFVSAPIRAALETPVTAGMAPMEVAETYYRAVSELDAETMNDCLYRKAGKADRRQVDMIYVTHRVRQGYEGLPDLPSADRWLAEGRPELPPGMWPWGVTDLELKSLPDGRIEARYLLWMPGEPGDSDASDDSENPGDSSSPDASGAANVQSTPREDFQGTPRVDILTLKEYRRSWRIIDIQRSYPDP